MLHLQNIAKQKTEVKAKGQAASLEVAELKGAESRAFDLEVASEQKPAAPSIEIPAGFELLEVEEGTEDEILIRVNPDYLTGDSQFPTIVEIRSKQDHLIASYHCFDTKFIDPPTFRCKEGERGGCGYSGSRGSVRINAGRRLLISI